MSSVCFYFQVHQPYRIKRYSYFQIGNDHNYFDDERNSQILKKVAAKCYLPTNRTILGLIKRFGGEFKVSYSITGTAIEQMKRYCPEALDSFVELAETGCVEFINETYYHSLSAIYDTQEFYDQISKHSGLMKSLFAFEPTTFRNTELIYSDDIARLVAQKGFQAVIAEGADDILQWRSPNYVYKPPGLPISLLTKNYKLSDDIAFRFSNRGWEEFPLTTEKFARWVHQISGAGEVVNLFMDYETFGEHQWESTGIFQFLDHLPSAILTHPDWDFKTPSEVVNRYRPVAELPYHRLTSWADVDRDLTAWRGNQMQGSALQQIFELAAEVKDTRDPEIIDIWRKLQTSDHFYYMCTKWFADGDVHAYFSPYDSPYDAFVNYSNVIKDFRQYYLGAKSGSKIIGDSSIRPQLSEGEL